MLALRKEEIGKMTDSVRKIHSTEQILIRYVIERLLIEIRPVKSHCKSRQRYHQHLIDCLSKDLQFERVPARYCYKRRVDAVDFKFWYFHHDLDVRDHELHRT